MAFSDQYDKQAALLIRTLPFVAQEQCFGLKGGSAINLFIRDMPRLSVDIATILKKSSGTPHTRAARWMHQHSHVG